METIKEQFNKVIKYSQYGIDNPQTDKLFKDWEKAKQNFIELFNGELIYEVPEKVTFEIDESIKATRINSFINFLWNQGYGKLAAFVEKQQDGFYKNIVVEEYGCLNTDDESVLITKDSKLVKAFKHFIKNKEVLNEIQNKASQLIQENKIEGTLCFSVHPLDYLSISENTYNWRSCHALDGEYRAGNLSYMLDSSTVVCYLKGADNVKLPHFPDEVPWNSKKWRVLLYFSNDWKMVFSGKPYPFDSETGMNTILQWLNLNIKGHPRRRYKDPSAFWTNWTDYFFTTVKNPDLDLDFNFSYDYVPFDEGVKRLYELVRDVPGSKHFNDVLKSSSYKPRYTYLAYKESYWRDTLVCYANLDTEFLVGGHTECLRCGKEEIMDSASTMMCYDCELSYGNADNDVFCHCEHCRIRMITEESRYVDDMTLCNDCFQQLTECCDCCGDRYLTENLFYNEVEDTYACHWCRS